MSSDWQRQTINTGRSLQVAMTARQVSLVSGHSVYAMDDHSTFLKLASKKF